MVERIKPNGKVNGHGQNGNGHIKKPRRRSHRQIGTLSSYSRNRPFGKDIRPKPKKGDWPQRQATSRNGGRKKGVPNRTTQLLKDAILLAAEAVGEDGKGLNGLVGYLKAAASNHPKNFLYLLARVLPYQVAFKNAEDLQRIGDKMTPQEAVQTYVDTLRGLQQGLRTPQLIDVTPGSPESVRGAARD